ncbi:SDR family NAD(P)-dependent oxidoreductase [Nonomuraea sp. NPDC050790]|uniref:SDR family NAD(P)-dependent oxidoreductase n=1 Tax=Nonomuraea sp. NPDC050790 TaxID=3364371 RepID=UPI003790D350
MALSPDGILLTGRVAVVTGGAEGIGRAVAEAFEDFGASVAICDRIKVASDRSRVTSDRARVTSDRLKVTDDRVMTADDGVKTTDDGVRTTDDGVEGVRGQRLAMTLDVRDPIAADVFARAVEERYGRVDILVNNTANGPAQARFAEMTAAAERTLIEENFTQLTAMIRRLLPLMRAGSSIINIGAAPGFAIQTAMTAAVAGLTASLAVELAPIRVNAIAQGRPLGDLSGAAAAAVFLAGEMARLVTGTTIRLGQE